MPPSAVVFGRTLLGTVFLIPLALRNKAFSGLHRYVLPVVVVTLLDMALPTLFTAWGEQRVTSSVAGILTATDPLFTALLALWLIRSESVDRTRFTGLVIGFAGVIALLSIDLRGNVGELLGAGAVLLSAFGYAGAALLYRRWLADAPALGVTALMTAMSSVAFLAPAAANLPRQVPPVTSIVALAALGIVNTGLAYWLFYLLIDEAGAATASVITYVMPVVALFLGVGLLGEKLTSGAIAGLVLIALGAWLATSRRQANPHAEGNRTAAMPEQRHLSATAASRSTRRADQNGEHNLAARERRSVPRRNTATSAHSRQQPRPRHSDSCDDGRTPS
jgi:drug/metabolite transporter (DMT)-like permease